MMKNINRLLSIALVLVMIVGFLPAGILHVHAEPAEEKVETIYRWELGTDAEDNPALCRVENGVSTPLTPIGGSVTATKMSSAYFAIGETITLSRDETWQIEWKATDLGTNGEKHMLLSNNETAYATSGHQGIYRNGSLHGVHYYKSGNKFAAYWTSADADANAHVYLIKNVVTKGADNTITNSVELYIDNNLIGLLNNSSASDTGTSTYLQDNDLSFAYIGNKAMPLTNMKLDYLQITKTHIHDYATEGETVVSTSCKESGYVVMSCECGATKNVPNGIYGEHTAVWTKVNGKAVLECTTCDQVLKSATYAWEKTKDENGAYYIKDVVTGEGVTTEDTIPETGVLTSYNATFGYSVTLSPSKAWTVEWKTSGAYWGMLLSKLGTNSTKNQSIFVPKARGSVCINHTQNKNHPAVVALADYTDSHVYTLKNELVTVDGVATNKINLYIDGTYVSTVVEHTDYPDYIHTTDLVLNGIGTSNYPLTSANLEYILVDIPADCDHTLGDWEFSSELGKVVRTCECGETVEIPNYYVHVTDSETTYHYEGFDDVAEAFECANDNGSTVCLNKDVTVEGMLIVSSNLSLKGYTLTAGGVYVDSDMGGNIIDDNGLGLLKVAKGNITSWTPTNHAAVWNESRGGYVMMAIGEEKTKTLVDDVNNTYAFYYQPALHASAIDELKAGHETSGVKICITVSWTVDEEAGSKKFYVGDELLTQYLDAYNENGTPKLAFKLTLTGVENVDEGSLNITTSIEHLITATAE